MEMSGSDHTMFAVTPTVLETQVATLNEVPTLEPLAWLPFLEDHIYTDNDFKTSTVQVQCEHAQTSDDILYEQVVQMEELGGEAIEEYSSALDERFLDEVTTEVMNSGVQASLKKNAKEKVGSPSATSGEEKVASTRNAVSSPKTSRKTTLKDHRRRREKATEREKQRIIVLKNAMTVLKNAIPAAREKTKVTKLEVLKLAQDYITSLKAQLMEEPTGGYQHVAPISSNDNADLFVYCNGAP